MGEVHICFVLKSSAIGLGNSNSFESDYQNIYKPAGKFLYAHQSFRMAFAFNGVLLNFLHKKHPEFIDILQELVSRKQAEILGGGYYDPAFPLLFPMDRTGQIEKLSSEIRQTTKKRPRGIAVCASIWDSSLVSCFSTCGMEYVLLDESVLPPEKAPFAPFIMSDKAKSVSIIPVCRSIKPDFEEPALFTAALERAIGAADEKGSGGHDRGAVFFLRHEDITNHLDTGVFERLEDAVAAREGFALSTPYRFLKACAKRVPVYVAAGMCSDVGQWAVKPYQAVKVDAHRPPTVYDFLQLYPQSKALYDRMLYMSLLVNQYHGDKMRKTAAREKLWEAQNGDGFICTAKGAFVGAAYRQKAYRTLNEVDKILREYGSAGESMVSFDYNGDGMTEYVCRMQNYFACINLAGGSVSELDVMRGAGNFADNLVRVKEFEGYDDGYQRGLFTDHLFTEKEFKNYLENRPAGTGIFSKIIYTEKKFNGLHWELELAVSALYRNAQKVTLRKRYVVSSGGMTVQYILKNESAEPLSAKFAVESSFAQTNFNPDDFTAFKLEIAAGGQRREINTKTSSKELHPDGMVNDVEVVQLTDTDNGVSFVFEPNEASGFSFIPIIFKRPEYASGDLVEAGMTFASALFWDVSLEAGKEMEKTINFSIFNEHKRRKGKASGG